MSTESPKRRSPGGRTPMVMSVAAVVLLLAGCGSQSVAELPPAAGPDRSPEQTARPAGQIIQPAIADGRDEGTAPQRTAALDGGRVLRLDPKARTLTLLVPDGDGEPRALDTIPVGVGPTQVACVDPTVCYVVDTQGDGLLVVRPTDDGREIEVTRRLYLGGAPYAIALDPERERGFVTLTARNELVWISAVAKPSSLRRYPTVRQPNGVRIDEATGDVTVIGEGGMVQRLDDDALNGP